MENETPKKLSELTLDELRAYYELAQKRFDQLVHYSRMNSVNSMGRNQGSNVADFNRKRDMVDRLTAEIDRRLDNNIDWRK